MCISFMREDLQQKINVGQSILYSGVGITIITLSFLYYSTECQTLSIYSILFGVIALLAGLVMLMLLVVLYRYSYTCNKWCQITVIIGHIISGIIWNHDCGNIAQLVKTYLIVIGSIWVFCLILIFVIFILAALAAREYSQDHM